MGLKVRESTNLLIEMMDNGMLSPRSVAMACLGYMSEDDVSDMARSNEFIPDEDEEESDYEDDEDYTSDDDEESDYEDYDDDDDPSDDDDDDPSDDGRRYF